MNRAAYDIGFAGIGDGAADLALNIADRGFSVSAYDPDGQGALAAQAHIGPSNIEVTRSFSSFIELLRIPRTVLILARPGPSADRLINAVASKMEPGDLIIDAGNSYFKDTDSRAVTLAESGIALLALGFSGGERDGLSGAAIMPGGFRQAYDRVEPIFASIAASVDGEPCVSYFGPRSAGNYVAMVHFAIEAAIVQLVTEAYDVMRFVLGMSDAAIQRASAEWDIAEVTSCLPEILIRSDKGSGFGRIGYQPTADSQIAKFNCARWAALDASDLNVAIPTIQAGVAMQTLAGFKEGREVLATALNRRPIEYVGRPDAFAERLRHALESAIVLTFEQGMSLLRVASRLYKYELALDEAARVWRGCGLIRSALVERMYQAYRADRHLPSLIDDADLAELVRSREEDLRSIVRLGTDKGIALPALSASLGYQCVNREPGRRDAKTPLTLAAC